MSYDTEFLLDRIYQQLNKNKVKMGLIRPESKIMNKKTYFTNFRQFCEKIGRDESQLFNFLKQEVTMNMSITGKGEIVMSTYVRQNQLEELIKKFIINYVQCSMCKSYNTEISKKNSISFMDCKDCFAHKSVNFD
jgi:translation initiation factor 2 subunit 2